MDAASTTKTREAKMFEEVGTIVFSIEDDQTGYMYETPLYSLNGALFFPLGLVEELPSKRKIPIQLVPVERLGWYGQMGGTQITLNRVPSILLSGQISQEIALAFSAVPNPEAAHIRGPSSFH